MVFHFQKTLNFLQISGLKSTAGPQFMETFLKTNDVTLLIVGLLNDFKGKRESFI